VRQPNADRFDFQMISDGSLLMQPHGNVVDSFVIN